MSEMWRHSDGSVRVDHMDARPGDFYGAGILAATAKTGDTVTEYRLPRAGDVDLIFTGECLADVDSKEPHSTRWSEVRIYRTDSHRYVTETVGRSTLDHEVDFFTVRVVDSADQVKVALKRRDEIEYLTNLAIEALEIAAESDPDIARSMVERI